MASHVHQQAEPVLACNHQAVHGRVAHSGVRVPGDYHAVGEIRPAVQEGMRRDGNLVEVRLRNHNFLRGRVLRNDGRYGGGFQGIHRVRKQPGNLGRGPVENGGDVFTVPPHARRKREVIALDVVKNQRLAALKLRAYARKLVHGVHRRLYMCQPSGRLHFVQAISQVFHSCPPVKVLGRSTV